MSIARSPNTYLHFVAVIDNQLGHHFGGTNTAISIG